MSIREDIEEAYKEVSEEAKETDTVESEPLESEQLEASDNEQVTDQEPPQEEETEAKGEAQDAEKQVSADSEESVPAPIAWSAEMQKHWGDLPSTAKKYIAEREKQMHQYISRVGGEAGNLKKEVSAINAVFEPFENDLKQANVTKAQAIQQMVAERADMLKDPYTFIKKFADAHKIDLLKAAVDTDMADPPEVRSARWQLEQQRQELAQREQLIQSQAQQAQAAQLNSYVESWSVNKPHFQTVRGAMAEIMPEIGQSYPYLDVAERLDMAYNTILKHPNFAHLNTPTPTNNQTAISAAKKAGSGLSGKTGTPSKAAEPSTVREAIMQAAKETGFI